VHLLLKDWHDMSDTNKHSWHLTRHPHGGLTIADYVRHEVMTEKQASVILEAVHERQNILVVGGTGSGKTTLIDAILAEITHCRPHTRALLLEDIGELHCAAANLARYRTSEIVSIQELVLRMRPDIIIVGEIRGAEVWDVLGAWREHRPRGGVASIRGDSAARGVSRLVQIARRNRFAPKPIEPLVAQAIDVVVNIQRTELGRRVEEILSITGHTEGAFTFERLA
jgi:type IV secretion system protein VirB11